MVRKFAWIFACQSYSDGLKQPNGEVTGAPRWQSPAQRIRLQSGTPAGSNPALGFL